MSHDKAPRGAATTLEAYYRLAGTGTLVDPTNPLVDVLDPSDVAVVTDAAPTRVSQGVYRYVFTPALDAPLGVWQARWTGTINGAPVESSDPFEVVEAGTVGFDTDLLATVDDVSTLLGVTLDAAQSDRVERLLAMASGVARSFTRQHLSHVTDDTITVRGVRDALLVLPERPVTAVSQVTVAGDVVDPAGYYTSSDALRLMFGELWGSPDLEVTVTYSHGFDPVPADVVAVVAGIAARLYRNPDGYRSETIGDYSYTVDGSGPLTDLERSLLSRYRVTAASVPIR